MRTIKFRGKGIDSKEWVYGHYTGGWIDPRTREVTKRYIIHAEDGFLYDIDPETLGEFTGLYDKNGKEIYEGDIIRYYDTYTWCINPDCDPPLWGYASSLKTCLGDVSYCQGCFYIDDTPLMYAGIDDLEYVREYVDATEEDRWCDADGNIINESILGLEVVGNIYDNKEVKK